MRPAIVHLIGFPAAGKYTVAQALVAAVGPGCVLMDNHATGNLILSILDLEGVDPIPNQVWDRVDEVREVVYRTIADMSPASWSFVFTNVLVADDPGDAAIVERLAHLAAAGGRLYLPVRIQCDLDELITRVDRPGRAELHKWTDAAAIHRFATTHELVDLTTHDPIDVDTTAQSPADSVQAILDGWRRRSDDQGDPIR